MFNLIITRVVNDFHFPDFRQSAKSNRFFIRRLLVESRVAGLRLLSKVEGIRLLSKVEGILFFSFDCLTLTIFNCKKNEHQCDAFKSNK